MSQMTTTARLLRVFRVDEQLKGLESRLRASERFLKDQEGQLGHIEAKRKSLESQQRLLKATVANTESEIRGLDERMAMIRERMNSAQNAKEYKALQVELNTLKIDRDKVETAGLDNITKSEQIARQIEELGTKRDERTKLRGVAAGERDQRAGEIRARVEELRAQRAALIAEVPPEVLKFYDELMTSRGEDDEIMTVIEVADLKRLEFVCSGCMRALPLEPINSLLSKGPLTLCKSCGRILYLSDDTIEAMSTSKK